MRMNRTSAGLALGFCVLVVLGAGCGGNGGEKSDGSGKGPVVDAGGAAGACALAIEYAGAMYLGTAVDVEPLEGEPLGTGVVPACDDGCGAAAADEVELASIPGVSPEIAVVWGEFDDTVFVREGVEDFPRALRRLLAPSP
jgi:hypothetical protein